jgi:hypothetical protein
VIVVCNWRDGDQSVEVEMFLRNENSTFGATCNPVVLGYCV